MHHHKALCWLARVFLLLGLTNTHVSPPITFEMRSQDFGCCASITVPVKAQNTFLFLQFKNIILLQVVSFSSSLCYSMSSGFFLAHLCSSHYRLTFWESTEDVCCGTKKTRLGTQTRCQRVMCSLHLLLFLSPISFKTKAGKHTWHFHFRPALEQWMWIPHLGFITIHCPQVCLHFPLLFFGFFFF